MTKRLLMAALLCAFSAHAQTAQPIIQPHQTFVDGSGNPCSGCSLFSYAAGTTTPIPTYTDASGTVQNTNPIILDAAGGASIWIGASSYKFVLADTYGTVLWTADQVEAPLAGSNAYLPLTGGTLTGGLTVPYFHFSAFPDSCPTNQYISGWGSSGWICATPGASGAAGGDLSGSYPNPTVAQVNGGAVPTSATVLGTNGSGQLILQTGTISNPTSGNAATATDLVGTPSNCTSPMFSLGIAASGNANCATLPGATFTGSSGYQLLASGLLLEWGHSGTIADGSPGTFVTFPLPFPHTAFSVTATDDIASGGSRIISVQSITTTGFTAWSDGSGDGAWWFAVGW